MAYFKDRKQIALLGGSFSPPHIGHVEICKYLLDTCKMDEVWVILCYEHPFGKKMAHFNDRLQMCRFAFQEFGPKVLILDVEKRLGGISHTVRTIQYLKEIYPGPRFSLVVGDDNSQILSKWRDFDKIKELVSILKVPRGENSPIPNISSTDIRNRIKNGEPIKDFVTVEVAVYIITHGLFKDEEGVI